VKALSEPNSTDVGKLFRYDYDRIRSDTIYRCRRDVSPSAIFIDVPITSMQVGRCCEILMKLYNMCTDVYDSEASAGTTVCQTNEVTVGR